MPNNSFFHFFAPPPPPRPFHFLLIGPFFLLFFVFFTTFCFCLFDCLHLRFFSLSLFRSLPVSLFLLQYPIHSLLCSSALLPFNSPTHRQPITTIITMPSPHPLSTTTATTTQLLDPYP